MSTMDIRGLFGSAEIRVVPNDKQIVPIAVKSGRYFPAGEGLFIKPNVGPMKFFPWGSINYIEELEGQ